MSSTEGRKRQKARKARLLARKRVRSGERWRDAAKQVIAEATSALKDAVTSGKARIAIVTIMEVRTLLAAMWEPDGVHLSAYDVKDEVSLAVLATAALRHVSAAEWADFLDHHLQAITDTGEDQQTLSMIEWRPGEGPHAPGWSAQG